MWLSALPLAGAGKWFYVMTLHFHNQLGRLGCKHEVSRVLNYMYARRTMNEAGDGRPKGPRTGLG